MVRIQEPTAEQRRYIRRLTRSPPPNAALWAERGLSVDNFTVLTPLTDGLAPADYRRAAHAGITDILTMFYAGPDATLAEKVDGMRRFRKDLALDG